LIFLEYLERVRIIDEIKKGNIEVENALTFLGEINLTRIFQPDADFGDFINIPNASLIHQLAAEFREHLELIPYQETGDPMQLGLAIYLRPVSGNGRIIAILVRDPISTRAC